MSESSSGWCGIRRRLAALACALLGLGAANAFAQTVDLQISALSVGAAKANPGGTWTIPVTYTVTNVGTTSTAASWYDIGYLSANGVLDAASQSNSYLRLNSAALAPGGTYTANASFTTNNTTAGGNYTFFVKADGHNATYTGGSNTDNGAIAEVSESNNVASALVKLDADLQISGLVLGAPKANPGGTWTIPVTYTVTNVGTSATVGNSWYDIGYLSANGVLDAASQSNSYLRLNSVALAPGGSYTANASFTTNTTTAGGNYTFFVKADGHNTSYTGGSNTDSGAIAEVSETNNIASAPVKLDADLQVSGLVLGAPKANPGGTWTIPVTYTVTNIGTSATVGNSWYDIGYLSANGVLDAASQSNSYLRLNSAALAPGGTYTANASFTTNNTTAGGNYTFFVKADGHNATYTGGSNTDNGAIAEVSESNNVASAPVKLDADLRISGLVLGTAVANANGSWTIPVTYTVTNIGTSAAAGNSWYDIGYLSANGVLDAASQSNSYLRLNSVALAPGGSYTASASFTTSTTTPGGSYTFFVKADGHNATYTGGSNTDNGALAEVSEANNVASAALTLMVKGNTTTSLASSVNPSALAQNTTLTATVTGTTPTGSIVFKDGATMLATVALSAGQASYVANFASVGTHSLTASYGGDTANNASSSAALTQTVTTIATTTAVASTVNPTTIGQSTTLNVSVVPSAATGTVTFKDGTTAIGTRTLSGGAASMPMSFGAPGAHSLMVVYAGDSSYAASTSAALTQTVNKLATATTIASNANPAARGQNVTLTATVTGGSSPTGTVTFRDGAAVLGTGALSAGTASFTGSFATVGSHSLTASYGGDSTNAVSTSAALGETITPIGVLPTTLALTTSLDYVRAATPIVLSATLSGGQGPTGSIVFKDGGTTIATVAISAGQATATPTLSGAGQHSLSASYAGDPFNLASVSNVVPVQVELGSPANPGPMTWTFGYDAQGNRWIDIDPNGNETTRNFDSLNRPDQLVAPAPNGSTPSPVTTIGYNGQDNVVSVKDPRNLTTGYTVDGLDNVKVQASPDSGTTNATYDAAGNVLTQTDARGKRTTYTYDALNRVKTIAYATGIGTTFEYDGGAAPYPGSAGKLTKITDESGVTTLTYDALGHLVSRSAVIGVKTLVVAYAWGSSGTATDKITSITYPSNARVNYSYDAAGRVLAVTVNPPNANGVGTNTGAFLNILGGVTYNADNNLKGWTWANNAPYVRTFDSFGRLSTLPIGYPSGSGTAAGLTRTLGYDNAGRITSFSHANTGGAQAAFNQGFGYDGLDRLTQQTTAALTYGYAYDATGNRTALTLGANTYTNTVSPTSNRLTNVQTPGTGGVPVNNTQTYTAAGSLTADGVASYVYSDRGRMSSSTFGGSTTTYKYNALEQRVSKTGTLVPTGAAYYAYDEDGKTIGEYDANLYPVAETVYIGTTPVAVLKETGTAAASTIQLTVGNVYADQIDTPRVVTRNSDEAILWRWDGTEAFGNSPATENPSGLGVYKYNQRMPGQVFDAEDQNFYNWNRDYQARTGRYAQSDPIGLAGGINTFTYVGSGPAQRIDRSGLWDEDGHDYFIDELPVPLTRQQREWMKKGSAYTDRWDLGFQDADHAYMHAMTSSTLSLSEAQKRLCRFVSEKLDAYRKLATDPRKQMQQAAYFNLGMALHPLMDSTSPAHRNFRYWQGRDWYKHGNWLPSTMEDRTVARFFREETIILMKDAMSGELPSYCNICNSP